MGPVQASKLVDGQCSFQQPIATNPPVPDAGTLACGRSAELAEAAPGLVQIPGHESEFIGAWVEIQIIVLPVGEQAIVVRHQNEPGEKPRKLIQVQELADAASELRIVGMS